MKNAATSNANDGGWCSKRSDTRPRSSDIVRNKQSLEERRKKIARKGSEGRRYAVQNHNSASIGPVKVHGAARAKGRCGRQNFKILYSVKEQPDQNMGQLTVGWGADGTKIETRAREH